MFFSCPQLLLVAVLASLATAQQYPQQYQVHDNGESSSAASSASSEPDYSKYYASETSPGGQTSGAAPVDESGFVRPIDFSALFGVTNAGFGGDSAGSTQIFRPANSDLNNFALPLSNSANVFPAELEGSATTKNSDSGFTSPNVKFQSFFDVSGSATEVGFRPQDFLKPAGDKSSEESSPVAVSGFYSPSFAKLDAEYNSRPGPHYSHRAIPAAAEQRPSKSKYRVSAEPEDEDSPAYSPASSKESYDDKPSYKASPTEGYSFKPTYKPKKPEYEDGKSSYATSSEKYSYRPVYSSPSPDRTSSSEAVKSTYRPSSDYYASKASYRPSPSEHQQRSKPIYSSAAPLDIYGNSAPYLPASTEQREEKPHYSPQIDSDIIYGKGLAPPFTPLSSEPHQGKSSYPAPYPTDIYNDKYVAKPSPSAQSKFYSSTTKPFSTAKPSSVPSVPATEGSPSNKEESYEEETPGHGPPDYAPSGTATDKKKCKKIEKRLTADDVAKGRFRRDAMTCYECEDPKTGGTFEQCSYTSDPHSKSYFIGHAQKYSTNSGTKPTTYRYRRYLSNDPFGLAEEEEELVAAESHSRVARQDYGYEFAASGNNDKNGDYRFGPEYFTSSSDDYTEYKPSGTSIDQKNCKKTTKDSMTCMVCKDPKTGGSYEQCSYSAKPKENNYFVAHETSFNTGNKKPYTEQHSEYDGEPHSRHIRQEPSLGIKKEKSKKFTGKSKVNEKYDIPYEYSASTLARRDAKDEKTAGAGLDPFLYGEPEPYNPKTAEKVAQETEQHDTYFPGGKSYDDYFRHLFPELHDGGKESASSDSETYEYPSPANTNEKSASPGFEYKSSLPEYFTDNEQKKDLEKVLGEFTQKDRSACKKVIKDKMTCYQCVDSKGMQHEECMFVAASEPKSSHLAYHEVKEYRLVPPQGVSDGKGSASSSLPVASDSVSSSSSDITKTSDKSSTSTDKTTETVATSTTPKPKRKTFFKKVTTTSTSTASTPVADSKYGETSKVEILKTMQKPSKPLSSSSPSSSEKSPAVAVKLTRRSSKTSVQTTTTTLTTPDPPPKKRKLSKKDVMSDSLPASSEISEKKVAKSNVVPPEPELSASDLSPDGYYSAETKTRFDPVLKVTLPEYMLRRSEHEAIFDEVMASGRRR
jgi:hypothetical protein